MSTETTSKSLRIVRLDLDARGLSTLGRMLRLPLRKVTTNYLVHCALGELFQEQAPQPFSVEDRPSDETNREKRYVRVLGYTYAGSSALQEAAEAYASPTVYKISDWQRLDCKKMPVSFPEGMKLRFELQACPVIRKASAGEGVNQQGKKKTWRKGQELDAFLSEAYENPDDDLSREKVYRNWLKRQFEIRGGATIDSVGMNRFSIERMSRRTHGKDRKVRTIKRPDVTLRGVLEVTDSPEFAEILKKGIGRHKSFGYGMLKVRRA